MRSFLAPDGRVFFVDEAAHGLWDEDWVDRPSAVVRLRLLDGSLHHVVKALWTPSELEERLTTLGWAVLVEVAGPFYWGRGVAHEYSVT